MAVAEVEIAWCGKEATLDEFWDSLAHYIKDATFTEIDIFLGRKDAALTYFNNILHIIWLKLAISVQHQQGGRLDWARR